MGRELTVSVNDAPQSQIELRMRHGRVGWSGCAGIVGIGSKVHERRHTKYSCQA
jgi:hypothetical protein